jgi:hypothetical protein
VTRLTVSAIKPGSVHCPTVSWLQNNHTYHQQKILTLVMEVVMKSLSKKSLFSLQTLILLSALVVVDAGSAVQPQTQRLQAEPMSVAPKAAKSRNPQCAVWATCNGQRQAVRLETKKALILAVAMGLGKNS